jgi:hypothetical protein
MPAPWKKLCANVPLQAFTAAAARSQRGPHLPQLCFLQRPTA